MCGRAAKRKPSVQPHYDHGLRSPAGSVFPAGAAAFRRRLTTLMLLKKECWEKHRHKPVGGARAAQKPRFAGRTVLRARTLLSLFFIFALLFSFFLFFTLCGFSGKMEGKRFLWIHFCLPSSCRYSISLFYANRVPEKCKHRKKRLPALGGCL